MHKTSIVCYPKSVGKDLQYQEMLLLMFCLQLILGTSAYYNVIDCLDIAFPTIYTFSDAYLHNCKYDNTLSLD